MKKFFFAVMLLAGKHGTCQNGAFANSFPFSVSRGLGGNNWGDISQAADGSIFTYSQILPYQLITATGYKTIHFSKTITALNPTMVSSVAGKWLSTPGMILQRVGDSIYLKYKKDELNLALKEADDKLLAAGYTHLYLVSSQGMYEIPKPLMPGEITGDSLNCIYDLYTGKPMLVYRTISGKALFYKLSAGAPLLEFSFAIDNCHFKNMNFLFGQDSAIVYSPDNLVWMYHFSDGKVSSIKPAGEYFPSSNGDYLSYRDGDNISFSDFIHKGHFSINSTDKVQGLCADQFYNSCYAGGPREVVRIFPHIKQYPRLYNHSNSNSNHSIMQTDNGDIYVGSYNGMMTKISSTGISSYRTAGAVLPGGLGLGNSINYFSENPGMVLTQVTGDGQLRGVSKSNYTGFYLCRSIDGQKILAGFAGVSSIGISDASRFMQGKPDWKIVDSNRGVHLVNIITITEDRLHRLWFGRTSEGWGVYYPDKDSATTFTMQKGQTTFGACASICDSEGYVWLAGNKGLWYADANKPGVIESNDPKMITHPLLAAGTYISSMKQWGQYLLLGADKNLLLLDLDAFHRNNTIKIYYYNPEELNLTARCEQNTMLIDKRDSSVWLATTDNVYNLDIRKWLSLPKYRVNPLISINSPQDTVQDILQNSDIVLSAGTSNFQLKVSYQGRDNMPRYIQTVFAAEGDSLVWSGISAGNLNHFLSCKSGSYRFGIRVFQADGNIETYWYNIRIRKFLWEHWWFWILVASLFAVPVILWLNSKRRRAIQQKQLSQMNIVSLSNQFRPHFILNTLNAIGADLKDKPEAEAVISRLGESINLIFRHAQQKRSFHSLKEEWMLVKNVIEIHRLMYIPDLELSLPADAAIEKAQDLLVPLGILQIPVENALLHGLHNKRKAPYLLSILLREDDVKCCFDITDNGVGRARAATLSNFKKHGAGTKNLDEIVAILNKMNQTKITISYRDALENTADCGTTVSICIPKKFTYET